MQTAEFTGEFVVEERETTKGGPLASIYGRAVPYATETTVGGVREQFAAGSFAPEDVIGKPLAYRHGEPIGVIREATNEPDGLYITADILDTVQGRDAAVLARGGAMRGLSVGFIPTQSTWSRSRDAVTHTAARLLETSLTHMPAYATAGVSVIREETKMTEVTEAEGRETPAVDTEAREALEAIRAEVRSIESKMHSTVEVHPMAKFRNSGEYRLALLNGEVESRSLFDQVTSANEGVLPPNWLREIKGIVDLGRPAITAVGTLAAGASGMEIYWPYYDGDLTAIVAPQASEKAQPNSVAISILKGNASLETYAAGSDISYQLIQRSDPSYIDAHNRIMALAYARTTNAAFSTALVDNAGGLVDYNVATDTNGGAFRAAVFAASTACRLATGAPASTVLVGTDVFLKIGGWETFYPSNYGTFNVSGTAQASDLRVSVSGLEVVHNPDQGGTDIVVTNRVAASWIEDGPRIATVENVAQLGRDVAIYGYGASALFSPAGVVLLADATP